MPKETFLQMIVQTPEFKSSLVEARDSNVSAHLETDFTIARKFMEGKYVLKTPEYKVGKAHISEYDTKTEIKRKGEGFADGLYDFCYLHFHGDRSSHSPLPSPTDFIHLNLWRSLLHEDFAIKTRPISFIASYDDSSIFLIALQEMGGKIIDENKIETFAESYTDELIGTMDLSNLNPLIRYIRKEKLHICEFVEFDNEGNPLEESVKKLGKFSDDYSIDNERLDKLVAETEKLIEEFKG